MKRILLISSMIVASTGAFAQSKTATPAASTPAAAQNASMTREVAAPAPVSKNAFAEQVKQLDNMLASNKTEEAKNKWNEVSTMMMNSLREMQGKMRAANEAKNEEEKKRIIEQMTKQRLIYSETMSMREDMATNRVKLNNKLNEFTAAIAQ